MKTTLFVTLLFMVLMTPGFAQQVPQGMNYQAVARDAQGAILADESIDIIISLATDREGKVYVEHHQIQTNKFGVFTMIIGEGSASFGAFDKVPWSENEIWMQLDIKSRYESEYVTISNSKMLSVPYAFHAGTATRLSEGSGTGRGDGETTEDDYTFWRILGNRSTDPTKHKLGTTDFKDLIIATNNEERIRVIDTGNVIIRKELLVEDDLTADQSVFLNKKGGETINYGNLIVEGKTHLKEKLGVDSMAVFNSDLKVDNMSSTHLTGTLLVDKIACLEGGLKIGDTLQVGGEAPTILSGSLFVGGETNMEGNLNVTVENSSYIATFENTNGDTGDGIKIKLGKTHPRMQGNTQYSVQVPGFTFLGAAVLSTKDVIKGLMMDPNGTFTVENFSIIGEDIVEALEAETQTSVEDLASAACNLTKDMINEINDGLDLPWYFPEVTIPELELSPDVTIAGFELPGVDIGPYTIIEKSRVFDTIPVPSCPPPPSLSGWDLPDFRITDVPNSLSHENVYVQFVDKNDVQVGAIRAESIEEWCDRYLSLTYCLNVFNSFAGVTVIGLDPSQILETLGKYAINSLAQISNLADAYNSIGVEYSSGFGDYAEWLERADHHELISAGDIVAVKGGKITRDLTNAEQIMAISSNPIVLGNIPEAGKDPLGNKVAFMGQIPVKIMGPVASGDYIVANGNIPGYGVAIHPVDMSAELMRLAVGRSWENLTGAGPKMVNTVVGVHNGDYIHIIQKLSQQIEETDSRLTSIENKLEILFPSTQGQNGLK